MIHLEFTAFDLEYIGEDGCFDSVTVFDGESVIPLKTLCGSEIPRPITSSGSSMIVRFTSDDIVTAVGFSVKYTTLAAASSDPGKCSHQLKLYLFG